MVLQRDEISKRLPHREAMLLLDSMTIRPDGTVEAVHGFRGEEWFFKGHFPQRPIVPGVIICEIMAQACCGLFSESMEGKIPYLVAGQAAPMVGRLRGLCEGRAVRLCGAVLCHTRGGGTQTTGEWGWMDV